MLELKDLSFSFGDHEVLSQLYMSFALGKITGIVGHNGVGKTTLFRIMTGMYRNYRGSIIYKGDVLDVGRVGLLPTQPYFYPYMTGKEYLEIVIGDLSVSQMGLKLARQLNIPVTQLVESYSEGMRKKLAFAAVKTQDRFIQIYDEPFNGVDFESNAIINELISNINKERIVIISSHILSILTGICDRIYYVTDKFAYKTYYPDMYEELADRINRQVTDRLNEG